MTTLESQPYWGIPRVELHEARRRAHAERAKLVGQIFAALVTWRLRRSERRAAGELTRSRHLLSSR